MIIVKEIKMTCGACPSQWEGTTDDDRRVYVRYRYGRLSVKMGPPGNHDEWAGVRGDEIFADTLGGNLDGVLTYDELGQMTAHLIQWPETCGLEEA